VHSLWQGLAAAIIGGVIIAVTRKTNANLRYNLLLLLFGFFLVLVSVTFIKELSYDHSSRESYSSNISPDAASLVATPFSTINSANNSDQENFTGTLIRFFNEYASLIVLLWFVLFIVHCLKIFYDLRTIRRLKKSAVLPSKKWKLLTEKLSARLALTQTVVLMESSLVNVPLTFGYLKATILVPLGLLSNLPLDQVEAVLLHELAHIRRKDYLVNLLQSVVDIIFFFNPGVLWLSSVIRQEREACCDDIVLLHMPQRQTYLNALVSFQEYSLYHSASVVTLTYKKSHLLYRIKRMLTKENQKLNSMEKILLLLGIIAITAFGFIPKTKAPAVASPAIIQTHDATHPVSHLGKVVPSVPIIRSQQPQKIQKQMKPAVTVKKDTVPNLQKKIFQKGLSNVSTHSYDDGETKTYEMEGTDEDGKKYRVKKVNNAITEFLVDGKTEDPAKKEYAEVLEQFEALETNKAQRAKEVQQRKIEAQQKRIKKEKEIKIEHQERNELHLKQQEQIRKEHKQKIQEQKKINTQIRKSHDEQQKLQKLNSLKKQEFLRKEKNIIATKNNFNRTNEEISSIINDLTENDLINNAEVLSFSLNNHELMVNGKRQPAEMHQSFKQKYIQKPGDVFNYSKKGSSTSITINKE
jgi:beta-lactamase regulating signal transducer with metallopeptidase domain